MILKITILEIKDNLEKDVTAVCRDLIQHANGAITPIAVASNLTVAQVCYFLFLLLSFISLTFMVVCVTDGCCGGVFYSCSGGVATATSVEVIR